MERVLIVEDDENIRQLLKLTLASFNYELVDFENGKDAYDYLQNNKVDLAILDLMLPGMNGYDILKFIRSKATLKDLPVIILSAKDKELDKIMGLDLGADDYLTKPFSVDELLARLRVTIRRLNNSQTISVNESVYENGNLTINYAQGCVYENGHEIHLTPIEYKLLCVLAKNTDKVLTHNYIMQEVWGSVQGTETPSLRVFMATLRKKIEPDTSNPKYIQTHVGVGYRMLRQTEKADQTSESLS